MHTNFWKYSKGKRPFDHTKKERSKLIWGGTVQCNNRILVGYNYRAWS